MAKPTCIACKGAGGGVSEDKVQQMIDTSIEFKEDGWKKIADISSISKADIVELLKENDVKFVCKNSNSNTIGFTIDIKTIGKLTATHKVYNGVVTQSHGYGSSIKDVNPNINAIFNGQSANTEWFYLRGKDLMAGAFTSPILKAYDIVTGEIVDATNVSNYITYEDPTVTVLKTMVIQPYGFIVLPGTYNKGLSVCTLGAPVYGSSGTVYYASTVDYDYKHIYDWIIDGNHNVGYSGIAINQDNPTIVYRNQITEIYYKKYVEYDSV